MSSVNPLRCVHVFGLVFFTTVSPNARRVCIYRSSSTWFISLIWRTFIGHFIRFAGFTLIQSSCAILWPISFIFTSWEMLYEDGPTIWKTPVSAPTYPHRFKKCIFKNIVQQDLVAEKTTTLPTSFFRTPSKLLVFTKNKIFQKVLIAGSKSTRRRKPYKI